MLAPVKGWAPCRPLSLRNCDLVQPVKSPLSKSPLVKSAIAVAPRNTTASAVVTGSRVDFMMAGEPHLLSPLANRTTVGNPTDVLGNQRLVCVFSLLLCVDAPTATRAVLRPVR